MMIQVLLNNIQLHGYHGVHSLEKITGTNFTINLVIDANIAEGNLLLEDTIDYASVFELLKYEFAQTEDLLENLSNRIIQKIFTTFIQAEKIELTILKNDAPITGFCGQVGIRFCKTRQQNQAQKSL
jgi:dihydroneopterin aldolase